MIRSCGRCWKLKTTSPVQAWYYYYTTFLCNYVWYSLTIISFVGWSDISSDDDESLVLFFLIWIFSFLLIFYFFFLIRKKRCQVTKNKDGWDCLSFDFYKWVCCLREIWLGCQHFLFSSFFLLHWWWPNLSCIFTQQKINSLARVRPPFLPVTEQHEQWAVDEFVGRQRGTNWTKI